MGQEPKSDPTLRGVIAFGIVIHQQTESAMSVTAAEHCQYMNDEELKVLHETAEVLARVSRSALAQRRRQT